LAEPSVVPRFVASLQEAGAAVTRVDAYLTRQGVSADDIAPEAALMRGGCVAAIVLTSTAEAQGLVNALGGVDVLQSLVTEQRAPGNPLSNVQ
jgi:uroporphyrinogen-III synthase